MRPPLLARSWALTVATSLLLMTSSSIVMATASITVENGCLPADKTAGDCTDPVESTPDTAGDRTVTCSAGFILESTILDRDILRGVAKLKATCHSMCRKHFVKLMCPAGVEDCVLAVHANHQINCPDAATHDLYVNDKAVKSFAKCDKAIGWKDELNNDVFSFAIVIDDPRVTAFCLKKKPPPPPPTIRCDASSYEVDCTGNGCVSPTFDATKKLSCPVGQKLLVMNLRVYDHAVCTNTGWEGHTTAPANKDDLIIFSAATPAVALPSPDPKLRAHCHKHSVDCTKMFVASCPPSTPACTVKPTMNQNKLTCATGFLTIDGAIYKDAVCSNDGWKANTLELIKYTHTSFPYPKITAYCQTDCSSLFEDDCPSGVCKEKPALDAAKTKISCPTNNILIVNGKDYKDLTCSTAGWSTSEATPKKILDYSSGIKQLKARCVSRCHKQFVDTKCASADCNQPIYVNEGEVLFCRYGEQLELNGKEVPDVICNIAEGWKDGATLLVPFTEYTTNTVKAECKPKPTTTTQVPTTTTAAPSADAAAKEGGSGNDMPYIIIIILLIGVILVGTSLFCWHMKKKKKIGRDDDEENPSRTKTDSKNKSSKNKKGKKNKKGEGKSEKKKGKKNKKEKSKKEMEVDSDVEVPVQQMSMPNDSTVPLTLAARAPVGANPNVMDV